MSERTSSSQSGGIGFFGLLTIVFIVLKLTGVINWSWLWVLSPMFAGVAILIGILLGGVIICAALACFSAILERWDRK